MDLRSSMFDLHNYRDILLAFKNHDYHFNLIRSVAEEINNKTVFLRHDIDLYLFKSEEMARVEYELNSQSTYYVLLTGHYNIFQEENIKILKKIKDMGHDIGLHYDLCYFPKSFNEAYQMLKWKVEILNKLIGIDIRTITTHQPYQNLPDPFIKLNDYIST